MIKPGSSILSISQFDLGDIERICEVADGLEKYATRKQTTRVLEGAVLANLFFEPSTRTRISFGAAFNRLGGAVLDTTGASNSSISKGESLSDTSRVVSGYSDVIVLRHPDEAGIVEFAHAATVPVINGGNGPGEHPSQALLDYYTLRKELAHHGKKIDGMTFTIVGDLKFGRTVHSLIKLMTLHTNITFSLAAPTGLELPAELIALIHSRGHTLKLTKTPAAALAKADAIYATRLQVERFTDEKLDIAELQNFRIDRKLLDQFATPELVVLHPLPRDSRENAIDLSNDLNGDPRLAIFRQTDAGIPIRMALFALVLGITDIIDDTAKKVCWHVTT